MIPKDYLQFAAFEALQVRPGDAGLRRHAFGMFIMLSGFEETIVANGNTLHARDGNRLLSGLWLPRFGIDGARGDLSVHEGDVIAIRWRADLVVPYEVLDAGEPRYPDILGALDPDGFVGRVSPELAALPIFEFPADKHVRH